MSTYPPTSRLIFSLTGMVILGLFVTFTLFLLNEYRDIDTDSRDEARQLAQLLDIQITESFHQIDSTLKGSATLMADLYATRPSLVTNVISRQLVNGLSWLDSLLIIDEWGNNIHHTGVFTAIPDALSRQPFYSIHKEKIDAGLYTSPPLQDPADNRWFIALSRRISKPDGRFGGIVAAIIYPEYFHHYHQTLSLETDDEISVFHQNGVGFSRYPVDQQIRGKSFANSRLFRKILPGSPEGVSLLDAKKGDDIRVVAHRKLAKNPLVITLALTQRDALTRWKQLALLLTAIYLGLCLLIVILARTTIQQTRLLKKEREFEKIIFDSSGSIAFILEPNGRILRMNAAAETLLGMDHEALINTDFWKLFANSNTTQFKTWMESNHLLTTGNSNDVELLDTYGNTHTLSIGTTPLYDRRRFLEYVIVSGIDITERKRAERLVWHQATHDGLTDLPNRSQFLDRLKQAIKQQQRTKKILALLFLDLNNFKKINDTYGHSTGDQVLVAVSQRLLVCIREVDTAARYAGDEFTLLLPELSTLNEVHQVCNRIMSELSSPVKTNEHSLLIGASIGIALYPEDADNIDALISNADDAMYFAKSQGCSFCQFYSEMDNARQLP